jgi:MraZ protein
MFLGEFEYKIDEKGRVPIPPRFRKDLVEGAVLKPGLDTCIVGYGLGEWAKEAERITSATMSDSKRRRLGRAMFATAYNLTLDGQGRISLPPALRQHAHVGDELIVIGVNTYFELWNKELWEAERTLSQEQSWQIMEGLEER